MEVTAVLESMAPRSCNDTTSNAIPRAPSTTNFVLISNIYDFHPNKEASLLGSGAFGTVHRMRNPIDGAIVAVKKLSTFRKEDGSKDEQEMKVVREEIKMMGAVQSDFITSYKTSMFFGGHFYIVMECLDGLVFKKVLEGRASAGHKALPASVVAKWAKQLASGIDALSKANLVHQDLHNEHVPLYSLMHATTAVVAPPPILGIRQPFSPVPNNQHASSGTS